MLKSSERVFIKPSSAMSKSASTPWGTASVGFIVARDWYVAQKSTCCFSATLCAIHARRSSKFVDTSSDRLVEK